MSRSRSLHLSGERTDGALLALALCAVSAQSGDPRSSLLAPPRLALPSPPPASSPSPSGSALGVDRTRPAAVAPVIPRARPSDPCPADADGAGASSASFRDCAVALRRLPLSCFERSLGLFSSLRQGKHVSINFADEEAQPDLVDPAAPLARRHGLPQRRHPPPHRRRTRRAQRQQRRPTVEERRPREGVPHVALARTSRPPPALAARRDLARAAARRAQGLVCG